MKATRSMRHILRNLALAVALMSLLAARSKADMITAWTDIGNSDTVTINTSLYSNIEVYAGPVTIKGLGPLLLQGYCVDLTTIVDTGSYTFDAPLYDVSGVSNTGGPPSFLASGYKDVGNRLGFLMDKVQPTNRDEYAGLQLALWNQLDKNFSVSGAPDAYQAYLSLFSSYNPGTTYGDKVRLVWGEPPTGGYQNCIVQTAVGAVPEPSTMVLASIAIGVLLISRSIGLRAGAKSNSRL